MRRCPSPRWTLPPEDAPVRRRLTHRILAIVLVLTRLVLADFIHLPSVKAAVHDATPPMVMMAGEHCPGTASTPATPTTARVPTAPATPEPDELRIALEALDPDELSPRAALDALYKLRKLLERRK